MGLGNLQAGPAFQDGGGGGGRGYSGQVEALEASGEGGFQTLWVEAARPAHNVLRKDFSLREQSLFQIVCIHSSTQDSGLTFFNAGVWSAGRGANGMQWPYTIPKGVHSHTETQSPLPFCRPSFTHSHNYLLFLLAITMNRHSSAWRILNLTKTTAMNIFQPKNFKHRFDIRRQEMDVTGKTTGLDNRV